jgi:predicted RNA binding protein YcfA (HicA-like mRNA interferase family)
MARNTFAKLETFLLRLGFQLRIVPDSHIIFEHPNTKANVILRVYRSGDVLEPAVIAYVRRTLDEWGVLSRDQFDEQWGKRAVAS